MSQFKSVFQRFLKVFIGGFVASIGVVSLTQPTAWSDFNSMLNSLGLALAYGALSGLLLALQKWATWVDDPNLKVG